jgi:FHA domain
MTSSAGTSSGVTAGAGPVAAADVRPGGDGAAAPAANAWTAVVTADRDYFDTVVAAGGPDAAALEFPGYCPERRFRLSGPEMRIGRRSVSRGLQPEIDLTGPPADTGVSHLHAVLLAQPDGSWAIVDPGSANGTKLNEQDLSIGVRTPLHDGDRICLGGWTKLTIVSG